MSTGRVGRGLRAAAVGVALTVGLAACGSDGGTGPAGDLTEAEVENLLTALGTVFTPTPSGPTASAARAGADGPARVPTTTIVVGTPVETTSTCPAGGSLRIVSRDSVRVTVDVALDPTPGIEYQTQTDYSGRSRITMEYLGCVARDFGGGSWTFDASPGLLLDYASSGEQATVKRVGQDLQIDAEHRWDGLWSGVLSWSNGGRSGECSFNLAQAQTVTIQTAGRYSAVLRRSGTACGHGINDTIRVESQSG